MQPRIPLRLAIVASIAVWGSLPACAQAVPPLRSDPTSSIRTSQSPPPRMAEIYPAGNHNGSVAWFIDLAEKSGLISINVNGGSATKRYIIESTGSGAAILDYDNDGWPDIFLLNGTTLAGSPAENPAKSTSHLFHNNRDGTFTDVTGRAGLLSIGWGQGVCVGDYDNDGYDDLFVTQYGKNRLYHNNGDGTFKDVAEAAGVAGDGKEWGTGCAFIDYDRDGKLDLVVANYVQFDIAHTPSPGGASYCMWKGAPTFCGPRGLPSVPNLLYHNTGDGKFKDVSQASGIRNTTGHYCFSVSTLDYDDDGWTDFYIACDSTPSELFHNNHDGTFADVAPDAGVAFDENGREQASMGTTIGDYNGDGRLDIFKTNFSDDTPTLYMNNGNGDFSDTTIVSGLGGRTQDLGWGAMFMDVDNDGWPDLLIVNGHVYPEVDTGHLGSTYKEARILYHNLANSKFKDISDNSGPGISTPAPGRGLAIADLWNDGRLEAVINNIDAPAQLLVNVAKNANHWLGVKLIGTRSNRDGIGARVTVHAGQRTWVDEVRSGSSYDSSNDLRLHFGLGQQSKVSCIEVRWPDGELESFPATEVDRFVSLREGGGAAKP
jgi:enediyne biosynthesis protein E4